MSYKTQADLADDPDLRRRIAACAALEGAQSPESFAYEHRWELSAQPGWDEAYEYAITQGAESPGGDESVITDGMILAAVQRIAGLNTGMPEAVPGITDEAPPGSGPADIESPA